MSRVVTPWSTPMVDLVEEHEDMMNLASYY